MDDLTCSLRQLGKTRREFIQAAAAGVAAVTTQQFSRAATSAQAPSAKPFKHSSGIVQTVQGALDASRLGFTLPHEHVCASSAGFWQVWPEFFGGRASFVSKVVDRLKAARDGGVDTIVDVTPADVGRDIRLLEEVSRRSGMQIIACTGHWLLPSMSIGSRTVEELTDFFVLEISRGIEGTDIKPGVIKVATDREGVTPFLEKVLRAAARASMATGTPITTHTYAAARVGEQQASIFEAEGVSPAMVCLGHCDDTDDMDYLAGLARRGYTVGMDHMTWGIQASGTPSTGALSWRQRADCIKKLIDAGFSKRIFLSHDWYYGISMAATGFMEAKEKSNPDGILFNSRNTIPYLKQHGITEHEIRMITVENPKRFFGGLTSDQ